ncbi:hypothetical protein [Streptomyces decoyicus]|uniref:hypothetical protein n=1 Tax=Streptomyces decoyicus TaxID=249567 RepID=UPI002F90A905
MELRLIDPYGATVPGTINSCVPAANVAEVTAWLLEESAPKHAARNDGINGYRFHVADYRVQETPEPAVAARGTFLDLLATPALTTAA